MAASSSSSSSRSPALSETDIQDTRGLLEALYTFGTKPDDDPKLSKLLRHTNHHVGTSNNNNDNSEHTITSWKMQDYAYKRDPCPYPTRARGLFTKGKERIVARAYDKFFNVDEVSWTKWANLPDLTAAPYYLTLKSNGCLILIAALSPTELLVTSKHAIGTAKEQGQVSHAEMGERWLDRGLKKGGKTREELAGRLWKENWTCVAELCDDSYEEHILPYTAETSGLHLHGIVYNHPTLLTLPPPSVNSIASEYGFIETAYLVLNSIAEVKSFTSDISKTGIWQNQHVEGFVVRAALKPGSLDKQPHPNDLNEEKWKDERRVFMWKIKFDQPYLMWREWRETTKKILTEKKKKGDDVAKRGREKLEKNGHKGKGKEKEDPEEAFKRACDIQWKDDNNKDASSKKKGAHIEEAEEEVEPEDEVDEPTSTKGKKTNGKSASPDLPSSIRPDKIRNPETRLYAIWVEKRMSSHPEDFAEYLNNRGIIAVREAFLKWRDTEEGKAMETKVLGKGRKTRETVDDQKNGEAADGQTEKEFEKTLIVPIAVPGCGKTMIGVALSHLFGFAHTQSDDIMEKKAAKHFESKVAKLLSDNTVVFADKNNHLKQHRQAMAEIASKSKAPVRLIAIVYPLTNLPQNEIHRICSDRIVGRGENHQSLRPLKTGEHEIILMRFFSQTEGFDQAFNAESDAKFEEVIEMNVSWDFEKALEYVVEQLIAIGGIEGVRRPTADEMRDAVTAAKGYKPSIYKEMKLEGLDSGSKNGGKSKGARYYGIAVEVDLPSMLEELFNSHSEEEHHRAMFDTLKNKNRIETKPHVTLIHENELNLAEDGSNSKEVEFAKALWEKCVSVSQRWGTESISVTLTLGPLLVWDQRAMSIQVSKVEYGGTDVKPEDMPSDERKDSYHITVGTLSQEVRPIEGKWLLESAMKGETTSKAGQKIEKVEMKPVEVRGRVRGLF